MDALKTEIRGAHTGGTPYEAVDFSGKFVLFCPAAPQIGSLLVHQVRNTGNRWVYIGAVVGVPILKMPQTTKTPL